MVISISTALLIISVVVGIIFIPSLVTSLHGMRRSFVVIQQVCIVSNLLLVLLNEVLSTSDLDTETIQFPYTKFSQELGLDDLPNGKRVKFYAFVGTQLMKMTRFFAYYGFYLMSFMQKLDLYMMICHPLNYEKFKETKNVMKMLLIGSFICLAAACDNLIPIFAL